MNKFSGKRGRARMRLETQSTPKGIARDSNYWKRTESDRIRNQTMDMDVSTNYRVQGWRERDEIRNDFDKSYIPLGSVSSTFDALSPMTKSSYENKHSASMEGNYGLSRVTMGRPETSSNVGYRIRNQVMDMDVSANYRVQGREREEIKNDFDKSYIPLGSESPTFDELSPMMKSSFENKHSTSMESNYRLSRVSMGRPEASSNVGYRIRNQAMDMDVSANYRVQGREREEIKNDFDKSYIPLRSVSPTFDKLSPMMKSSFENKHSTSMEGNNRLSRVTMGRPDTSSNLEYHLPALAQGPQASPSCDGPTEDYLPWWNIPKKSMDSQGSSINRKKQKGPLNVVVVPFDYPSSSITFEQSELIQAALFQCFETLKNGFFPQFKSSYVKFGTLVLMCANLETKKWVKTVVPRLKPWEGAKLRVRETKKIDLNRMHNKVLFKIPATYSDIDCLTILDMLGMQNYPLCTKNWKILNSNSNNMSRIIVLLIDDSSLHILKKSGMNAFLGLGKIRLTILKERGGKHVD